MSQDSQPAKRVATKDIDIVREVNIASEGLGTSCKVQADRGRKSAEKLSLGMRKNLVSYEGDVDSGHGK
jgi:hypothetical protein